MKRIGLVAVAAAMALSACAETFSPSSADVAESRVADLQGRESYIITLREGVTDIPGFARQQVSAAGGELGFVYQTAVRGYSAFLPAAAIDGISRHPMVASVEQDAVVYAIGTQTSATWGLDRVDQRDLPLSTSYTYNADGSGVSSYILDTGILPGHVDFGGRVTSGYTAINDRRGTTDCDGHGTHVAGTVGGSTWGVAKNTRLIAVRVLDCRGSGTTSGVIAGVDWVAANHVKPAVANMSLGGGASSTLDAAVNNASAAGVTMVVAAGNSNVDACTASPARAGSAITVGATASNDARASYSNFGSCLDIFAPGSSITSAWYTSTTATSTISGTSMASPHVAGAAALYLQGNPTASPSTVTNALINNATTGKVTSPGTGSPNRLLYTLNFSAGGGGTPNQAPTASFTFSCSGLTCSFNGGASSDADGTISSHAWNFGDGTSGSGVTASKTYASAGTRTVTLTVTDNGGATGSQAQSVAVTAPSTGISLSVRMTKVQGSNRANLSWTGAAPSVDVFRNGTRLTTVTGTTYVDILGKGSGTRTYQVCNLGTTTCSNSVTVTF